MTSEFAIVARRCRRVFVGFCALLNALLIPSIRDGRHRPNEEYGHTAIPQRAIGALFAGNPSQCGGREFDM
jgi:hypothetical protein